MALTIFAAHRDVALGASLFLLSLFAASGYAQTVGASVDTLAPIIELEELAQGSADRTQVFTVQIAEDVQLQDAILYYRREGQIPYIPAPMAALGDTGFYSVSIETDPTDLRAIEYYVQARDRQGNRTVSGFAFDPYRRTLLPASTTLPPEPAVLTQIPTTQSVKPRGWYERRWVQVAIGVIAVGVVASLVDGDDGEDSVLVPVTFNLE